MITGAAEIKTPYTTYMALAMAETNLNLYSPRDAIEYKFNISATKPTVSAIQPAITLHVKTGILFTGQT